MNIANNDVNVSQEATWTTNFGDVNVDAFEQPNGPNLPSGFDTATATPLNYFDLLFKTEMFGKIVNHTNNYALFKRDEIRTKNNDPEYADPRWSDTSVPEIRALFGINILMGVSTLPQYHLYWHKDTFVGNAGVMDTMTLKSMKNSCSISMCQTGLQSPQAWIMTSCTRYSQFSKWYKRTLKHITILARTKWLMKQWLASKGSSPMSSTCLQNQSSVVSKCGWDVTQNLHEFDVYLGHQQNSIHGLAYDVMKLCQHIEGKNHPLYCDNYFTSILLFADLLNTKIYASGTIRQNKWGLPGEVKKKTTSYEPWRSPIFPEGKLGCHCLAGK